MLTDKQRDIISALAFSSMNVSAAARMLGCARSNILWHIEKIKEATDKDPQDFFDLHDLYNLSEE